MKIGGATGLEDRGSQTSPVVSFLACAAHRRARIDIYALPRRSLNPPGLFRECGLSRPVKTWQMSSTSHLVMEIDPDVRANLFNLLEPKHGSVCL